MVACYISMKTKNPLKEVTCKRFTFGSKNVLCEFKEEKGSLLVSVGVEKEAEMRWKQETEIYWKLFAVQEF